MRFFKNASKKVVKRQEKSLCDLGTARPKRRVSIHAQEKSEGGVQKIEKIMIFDVLVPEMKH